MDSNYLANMVGQPLSLALAEVCIVQPHDPIEWLSGWLYKYVDSAEALREYKKEKWELSTLERQRKEQEGKALRKEEAETGLRISSCNYIASLNEDPFNLWQHAIKAITTFTDCTAVYIAAITEPLWEPKPVKEKKEEEEGEEGEDESEAPTESEAEGEEKEGPYDSDEEERIEEEERKAEEAAEAEAAAIAVAEAEEKATAEAIAKEEADAAEATSETDAESEVEEEEEDDKKKKKRKSKKDKTKEEEQVEEKPKGKAPAKLLLGPDGEPIEPSPPPPPPPKPPRPVKYKKLIAKYLASSPSNIFMLNKELNKKMGPITWRVLEKGLSFLNIPNVLYKQGIYFFGGVARIGAYFVAPIVIRGTQKYPPRVVALLCADTIKLERIGTGELLRESEVFFLQEVARAITHAMNEDHLEAIKDIEKITPDLVVKIKDQFKEIKRDRIKAAKKAAKELKASQKAAAKEKKRLAKEERIEAKKKLQEKKAASKEAKKKEEEARRKDREAAEEELSEEEEEKEEEEEEEKEDEEVQEEEEEEGEGETGDEKSEVGESEVEESEVASETEASTEGGEDEEEEKEEEPEEPESDLEDWGEEPKEEGEEETDRATTDAETEAEIDIETELDETEGEESEGEETEVEETEGEETEGEGTEASAETDEEKSEGEVAKVIDHELEKKKVEKKQKAEERKKKVAENKKLAKEGAKKIKDKEKELAKLEKNMIKYKATMEELGEQMTKLEISLSKGDAIVKHHQLLVSTVMEHMLELKDTELKRIKCTPHPRRRMFRALKALLIVLDHKKFVIDDWIGARLLLNETFINDLENYDSFKPQDPMKWKLVESYIVGLTGKRLSKEAPLAYLGLKWLLRMKKLTIASAHYLEIKTKYEAQSKAMAAADLAKILGGVNVKVVAEDLKKIKEEEETRLAKVAEEDKKYAEEEARLKAIEDEEDAAKAAADEVAAAATETTEGSETGGETDGDESEAEE